MKRILTLFVSILVLMNTMTSVQAQDLVIRNTSDKIVASLLEELDVEMGIDYATPLYDGTDEINGYWYHLGDGRGYVIVFNWNGRLKVTEYSFSNDLDLDTSKKVYYDGIVSYFQESNLSFSKKYNSVMKSRLYKAPELVIEPTSAYNATLKDASLDAELEHSVVHINQLKVTGTGYDPATLCTQTASAMIVKYHNSYNGKTGLAPNSGEALVKSIIPFMKPDNSNGSTSLARFKTGLGDYISSKGYSSSISYQISDEYGNSISTNYPNTIYQDILNERPGMIIVGKNAEDIDGGSIINSYSALHALTVYGISTNSQGIYLSVNDPYGAFGDKTGMWDTYPYPGEPSAIYAVARVIIY